MPKTTPRDTAQKNAQHYFSKAEPQADTLAKKLQEKGARSRCGEYREVTRTAPRQGGGREAGE